MTIQWVAPVRITVTADNAYHDVDIDTYVAGVSGASGVIIHFWNESASMDYGFAVRKNGSTDARSDRCGYDDHGWLMIGVDASNIIEVKQNNAAIKMDIVGWIPSTDATFFTDAVNKSTATTASYVDVDCSADAPSAVGLIFDCWGANLKSFSIRKNGSTDDRYVATYYQECWPVIGCDAGQICEQKISDTSVDLFLVGYFTSGVVLNTNASDMSLTAIGEYTDLAALPSGALGGFFEVVKTGTGGENVALRTDGTDYDIYRTVFKHIFAFVKSANLIVEGKITSTDNDFFLVGYATDNGNPWYVYAHQ